MKNKLITTLLLLLLVGCSKGYNFIAQEEDIVYEYTGNPIEIKLEDLVEDFTGTEEQMSAIAVSNSEGTNLLEGSNVGIFYIQEIDVYTVVLNEGKAEKKLEIEVKDTTKPTIKTKDNYKFQVGDKIKYDIKAEDADEVEIKIEPELTSDKAGTFDVKVVATDKSGNESTADIKVIIEDIPTLDKFSQSEKYQMSIAVLFNYDASMSIKPIQHDYDEFTNGPKSLYIPKPNIINGKIETQFCYSLACSGMGTYTLIIENNGDMRHNIRKPKGDGFDTDIGPGQIPYEFNENGTLVEEEIVEDWGNLFDRNYKNVKENVSLPSYWFN